MLKRALLILGTTFVLVFAAGEILVRANGQRPWVFLGRALEEIEEAKGLLMHDPDPELGWISKPGAYSFPLGFVTRTPELGWLDVTIWDDQARATAPEPFTGGRPRVATIGCSFTFGWGVPGEETLAWRLNDGLQEHDVTNLGTGGYGSYQSLLRMERWLDESEGPVPELVVYGLAGGHGMRDVATHPWQKMLSGKGTEPVALPRAAIDAEGQLVRLATQSYPVWFGSQTSALLAWLQDRWSVYRGAEREIDMDGVHLAVVREMHRSFQERGTRLLVAVMALSEAQATRFFAFFEREGIDYVSMLHPDYGKDEYRVPVDGHPNGAMNAIWAEFLVPAVLERL